MGIIEHVIAEEGHSFGIGVDIGNQLRLPVDAGRLVLIDISGSLAKGPDAALRIVRIESSR